MSGGGEGWGSWNGCEGLVMGGDGCLLGCKRRSVESVAAAGEVGVWWV